VGLRGNKDPDHGYEGAQKFVTRHNYGFPDAKNCKDAGELNRTSVLPVPGKGSSRSGLSAGPRNVVSSFRSGGGGLRRRRVGGWEDRLV